MDLVRHLRFFTTVAKTAHFGRAAEELEMTQPPLSQGIKRLEAQLGLTLFERTTRGVRLTEAGRLLLDPAQAVVASAERFGAAASAAHTPRRAALVGVTDALPDDALGAIADTPGIAVTGGSTRNLLSATARGELSLAVVEHPSPLPEMHGGGIVRIASGIASASPAGSLRELSGRPLVTRHRSAAPAAHDLLIDTLHERAWSGPVVEVATHREVVTRLLSGDAWAVVAMAGAVPAPLTVAELRGLPPLRARVIWRADAPDDVVQLGRLLTEALVDWSGHAAG